MYGAGERMSVVRPRKSLGQHFLVDQNVARKIVDALDAPEGSPVIEIGPGMGALTGMLASRYPRFTALDVDLRAVEHLRSEMPDVDVRHEDVLTVNWAALDADGAGLYVIGNLPYNITSPILFSLFASAAHVRCALLMMQLEVAQRIVAQPRTKAYGILSVASQLFSKPVLLFQVSRNVFRPKPAVTSAVVRLDFSARSPEIPYEGMLSRTVRAAFNQRRKTLRNSLAALARECGRSVPDKWAGCRAEELRPEEFIEMARYLTR